VNLLIHLNGTRPHQKKIHFLRYLHISLFKFMTDLNSVWMQFEMFYSPLYGSIGHSSLLESFLNDFLADSSKCAVISSKLSLLRTEGDQNEVSHQYSQFHVNARRNIEL
jgi:hypothetical protein